ncbi:GGDEF domain-containing protein [Solidesulfovibrio sp.]|uniref:GGDEF domain-containing protein n=1 Tax=Solidesulfovibrio sp. TaxID=2910990 RepID=UPI0026253783|nr:GGDEF domain-containing protein [Solidesulfovibrio sp.]
MQFFDFRTACVIYLCSHVCIAVLLSVAFSDKRARGARLWIVGLVAQILSVPFFVLRSSPPGPFPLLAGNALFALSWVCFWASFDVFFGNKRSFWSYALPPALAAVVAAVFAGAVKPRVLLLTTIFAAEAWCIAAVVLRRVREFRARVILMLGAGYLLAGCSYLVRAGVVLLSPQDFPDPFAPSLGQNVAMLLSVPSLLACTLGFVLLHRDMAEEEVRRLADSDPLTGLQNRRGFEAAFTRELRGAARAGAWTSLALVDIDHFKAVNDRHGHGLGDEALRLLARIVVRELRGDDCVARIGGDEFCVLLPGAAPERAAAVAERLRLAVASHDWRALGLADPLTVTIGLSSHRGGADDAGEDFLRLADMALLAAKQMARDMVLHADALSRRSADA